MIDWGEVRVGYSYLKTTMFSTNFPCNNMVDEIPIKYHALIYIRLEGSMRVMNCAMILTTKWWIGSYLEVLENIVIWCDHFKNTHIILLDVHSVYLPFFALYANICQSHFLPPASNTYSLPCQLKKLKSEKKSLNNLAH